MSSTFSIQPDQLSSQLIQDMTEWRQHLHRFPECGFDVNLTSDYIASKLESFGIDVVRNIGKTGLVGIPRSGCGDASIGLRADMDALHIHEQNNFAHCSQYDGKMHACGHDGHSAMLLGAASYLAKHQTFDGTVYFIFGRLGGRLCPSHILYPAMNVGLLVATRAILSVRCRYCNTLFHNSCVTSLKKKAV